MSLGRSLRTRVSDPPISDRLPWPGLLDPGARELGHGAGDEVLGRLRQSLSG